MAPGRLFPYSVHYSLYVLRELQVRKSGNFKLIIIIVVLASVAFVVRYFINQEKTKHLIQESKERLELATVASELVALWRSGDPTMMAPFCRDMFDVEIQYHDQYFRCNPDYMKCLLSQKPKFGEVEASWLRVLPAKASRQWSLVLKLELNKNIETLILGDSCSQVELPKRRYSYKKNKKEDVLWDNFDQDIFIDKYPVNWRDVKEWTSTQNLKLDNVDLLNIKVRYLHLPAVGLKKSEMKEYCQYRGKELASLPVFEAASYHPRDKNKPRPKKVIKSPYPWSIYTKSDFLYKARKSRWKVNVEDCRKAYVKECGEIIPREQLTDDIPTWIGLHDTIGGVAEYLENPFDINKNLFLSNSELSAKSKWHELGQYAFWNGEGFSPSDFKIEMEESEIEFPLLPGFRCMVVK